MEQISLNVCDTLGSIFNNNTPHTHRRHTHHETCWLPFLNFPYCLVFLCTCSCHCVKCYGAPTAVYVHAELSASKPHIVNLFLYSAKVSGAQVSAIAMQNRLVLSTDAGAVLVATDRKCIVNTVDTEETREEKDLGTSYICRHNRTTASGVAGSWSSM